MSCHVSFASCCLFEYLEVAVSESDTQKILPELVLTIWNLKTNGIVVEEGNRDLECLCSP